MSETADIKFEIKAKADKVLPKEILAKAEEELCEKLNGISDDEAYDVKAEYSANLDGYDISITFNAAFECDVEWYDDEIPVGICGLSGDDISYQKVVCAEFNGIENEDEALEDIKEAAREVFLSKGVSLVSIEVSYNEPEFEYDDEPDYDDYPDF